MSFGRNQLSHIYQASGPVFFSYTYDAAGNMTKRKNEWAGVNDSTNCQYDALNRPTMWEQTGAGDVPFARSHYQYDKVNREVATWRDGPQEAAGSKGERFWYTTNNQVQEAWYKADNVWTAAPSNPATWRGYTYTPDKLSWSSVNDNGYNAPFAANALNQYTSINTSVPEYDPHFNLYRFAGFQYDHDAPNRLVAVNGNGHSASFIYDGLGRCVRRTVDGVTRLFTYDAWNPIFEWDQSGNWAALNIYGPNPDEILGRYDAARGPLIYKHDKQGNVIFLLNGSNQLIERYTYDAYGTPTVTNGDGSGARSSSNYGNRFMYTGREWLNEVGIYDYRHRYYLPSIGRFIETDPTGFDAGDMNLMRYCSDDPIDRTDPMGLLSGFTKYELVYDPNEKHDATHDGYHVAGVPGFENKPGDAVHLEVDRSVTTTHRIDGTDKGGDTKVTWDASKKGDTPTIHQQIDVRYAGGAGPNTREFTRNNEWTHSRDAVAAANSLRAERAGWVRGMNMSADRAVEFIRNGAQFGRNFLPSLELYRDTFNRVQERKYDKPALCPNAWYTPNGSLVAPHTPIDPYTGNPLRWNE